MSTEEMVIYGNTMTCRTASAREHGAKSKSAVKKGIVALRASLYSLVTLAGAGSFAFGFWMLAERQKNLGYIDVIIALAVVIGTAVATYGIAGLVRALKDGRNSGK